MHAVITGASTGIGRALAVQFSDEGFSVTLVARRKHLLQQLAAELRGKSHVSQCDLTNLEQCTDWVDKAQSKLGPIDVLVNNAGDYLADSVLDVSNSRAEDLMKVNLLAPMRLVRGILPSMLEQKVGVIVNISSLVSFCPAPYMVDYGASKSGLATYSESLGAELKGTGVHVVTVYPGPVSTSMEHAAKGKLSSPVAQLLPTGNAEELAFKILQAVRARTTRVIYPRVYETTRMFGVLSEYLSLRFGPGPKA